MDAQDATIIAGRARLLQFNTRTRLIPGLKTIGIKPDRSTSTFANFPICQKLVSQHSKTKPQHHLLTDELKTITEAMGDELKHFSSGQTRIKWLSALDTEFAPKKVYRRTSIICTIGQYR